MREREEEEEQYVPPVFARAMEAASQLFARDVWTR